MHESAGRGSAIRTLFLGALAGVVLAGSSCGGTSCSRGGDDAPPAVIPQVRAQQGAAPQPFPLSTVAVPGFPDFRAQHGQMLQLDRLPATWTLPEIELPDEVKNITDVFALEAQRTPKLDGAMYASKARLPFPLDLDEQAFRPEGLAVTVAGKRLGFSRTSVQGSKKPSWRIGGKFLVLATEEEIAPGTLEVTYPRVRQEILRHDPQRAVDASGQRLTADAFGRYGYSIRGATRHGLLLVAPTVAEWEVTLPQGAATFESWLALERPPMAEPVSDGATVSLVVVDEGEERLIGEQRLDAPDDHFLQFTADLSAWAGKRVKVQLRTSTDGSPVFDWIFAGSPTIWGPPVGGDVRRVVIVALDTTRPDHLSYYGYDRPTTPEIDQFGRTGVVFDHAWSTAPRTRPSFRSSTTGRLPLDAVGATNIAEVFAENGFATGGIVANPHLQPRFSFDRGYDSWFYDAKARAADQVDRALEWLENHDDQDGYLFLHIMDPHMLYDAPEPFGTKFVTAWDAAIPERPKRNQVLSMMKSKALSDVAKAQVEALHDGELSYTSHELGRLFTAIDAMPGRTLVILHSDHGEEFWEHGGFEHNHSLYDELVRTVFMIRPSGGVGAGRRYDAPVTLMDLGPTLYDLFGIDLAPPTDGVSLMPLIGGQDPPRRAVPVGYLQYDHERWGVVWDEHKYMLHTKDGFEELFDLKSDPGETTNLAASSDLAVYRQKLAEVHRIDVGPGFRVVVNLPPAGPELVLTLPARALLAGVLDPEAIVEHRANIEWGEQPKKLPFEVGAATLSADGTTLTFAPGSSPDGILYVLYEKAVDPRGVKATLGGTPIAFHDDPSGPTWSDAAFSVVIAPGTVVVPPATEAARMGLGLRAAAKTSDIALLCALGYHEGPDCEGVAPSVEDDDAGAAPELGD